MAGGNSLEGREQKKGIAVNTLYTMGGLLFMNAVLQIVITPLLKEGHKQTSLKEEIALVPESFPALIRGQKIAKKAAAAGLFSTEDEDVFKDLLTSVVNLQLGTAGEDPEKKFSSDEELSEKLGEVLFALCRFCAKYKVSGEMALLKKLEEF